MLLLEHLVHTVLDSSGRNESRSDVIRRLVALKLGGGEGNIPRSEVNHQSLRIRFNKTELSYAIRTLKQDKALGFDLIDVRMVRAIQKVNFALLLRLFNTCARFGRFPDKWNEAEVVFFVKRGKDATQSSAYRPICLLPVLSKVLEKLIKIRLVHGLENSAFLHEAQFGFRENISTESTILSAVSRVEEKNYGNVFCSCVTRHTRSVRQRRMGVHHRFATKFSG